MNERYIRASELRSFSFCRRAWFLEQQGQPSLLQADRQRGMADHQNHGRSVQAAAATSRLSAAMLIISVLTAIAAWLWWKAG